jgi:hypothetical protein
MQTYEITILSVGRIFLLLNLWKFGPILSIEVMNIMPLDVIPTLYLKIPYNQ